MELKGDHESRIAEPLGWLDVLENMTLGGLGLWMRVFCEVEHDFGWVCVYLGMSSWLYVGWYCYRFVDLAGIFGVFGWAN